MPHSVEWFKKYGPQGYIMLGFHSTKKETPGEIAGFCKANKVTFPNYEGGSVNGAKSSGLPTFILFDHTGKMIFNGRPSEANKKLADAVKNAPDPLVGDGPYKKLDKIVAKIKEHKDYGQILTTLKTKYLNSADADEKAEAEQLISRLTRFANKLLTKGELKREKEPLNSYNTYQQCATLFKGDEIGTNTELVLKMLNEDKVFQENMKADKELVEITSEVDKFKSCNKCGIFNKDCDNCRKKNAGYDGVVQKAKALVKKYPNSPAANNVKELVSIG
jgi:hypothetical protein